MTPARTRLLLFACCLALGVGFAPAAEPSRQQRLAALPDDDRAWLTDFVAPIILPEEERVFLQLTDAGQREGFKEDFWQRREKPGLPLPLGPGYRDRYRGLRQVIDGKYIGWESDAGRLILRRGEPESIFKPQCGGEEVFRDLEIWTYGALELNGHAAARHIFYRPAPRAPRKLWIIHDGNAIVFQPNACRASFDQLSRDCGPSREDRCARCEDRCVVYGAWAEILKRQGGPAGALAEQGELFNYPKIPTDGLDRSKAKWAAVAPGASAARLAAPAPTPTAVPPPLPPPPPPTSTATPIPTPRPAPPATVTPAPVRPPSPTATAASPRAVVAPVRTPTPASPTPRPTSSATSTPTPVSPAPRPTATPPASTPAPTRSPSPGPTAAPTRAPTLTPPPKPSGPSPTPYAAGQGLRRLSAAEIQERMKTLEPQYLEFLDLAKPFTTEEDVSRFLQLSDHDKESFMRDFWKRHT